MKREILGEGLEHGEVILVIEEVREWHGADYSLNHQQFPKISLSLAWPCAALMLDHAPLSVKFAKDLKLSPTDCTAKNHHQQ